MKKLIAVLTLIVAASLTAAGQSKKDDQVREFLTRYDKAVRDRDIAFLERVLANDYVYSGASGKPIDRSRVLAFYKRERDKPSYRRVSLNHDNIRIRAVGRMAVVTNDYTSRTAPLDPVDAEPWTTRGRHIVVFEKRKGGWMVIAEQDTEQPHDDKPMIEQVLKAGQAYNELEKRLMDGRSYNELEKSGDLDALKRVLADEYTYTSRDGEIFTKAQDLESYKTKHIKLTSAEIMDQNVRIVDNNTAVETGKIRYIGANAGKEFDVTNRYTTTWVFWDDRWQIVADHTSAVK